MFSKKIPTKGFYEIAATVAKDFGADQDHVGDVGRDEFHQSLKLKIQVPGEKVKR